MTGAGEITTRVLTGAHQITGLFLRFSWHADGGDLAQPEQSGQMHRVFRVGLDAIPGRALQFRRGRDHASDPHRGQVTAQAEAGRPGLIGNSDRPRQPLDP